MKEREWCLSIYWTQGGGGVGGGSSRSFGMLATCSPLETWQHNWNFWFFQNHLTDILKSWGGDEFNIFPPKGKWGNKNNPTEKSIGGGGGALTSCKLPSIREGVTKIKCKRLGQCPRWWGWIKNTHFSGEA